MMIEICAKEKEKNLGLIVKNFLWSIEGLIPRNILSIENEKKKIVDEDDDGCVFWDNYVLILISISIYYYYYLFYFILFFWFDRNGKEKIID